MSARFHRKAAIGLSAAMTLFIFTAETHATAIPTFGAFANTGYRWEGGFGDFNESKTLSWSYPTMGATVYAAADLATGSLHASTTAFQSCPAQGCGWGWGGGGSARLFDRYVFTNSGENIALIPVSLRVDGHCAGDAIKRASYRFAFSTNPIYNVDSLPYHYLTCGESVDVVAPINLVSWVGDSSWYAFVEISAGVHFPDFDDASSFGVVDFGNTLKVDIVLPEGVTMHSDSGVFPYRYETTAIPEPAAIALFGTGALAGILRGRRRKVGRTSDAGELPMDRRLLADIGIGRGDVLIAAHDVGLERMRRSPFI